MSKARLYADGGGAEGQNKLKSITVRNQLLILNLSYIDKLRPGRKKKLVPAGRIKIFFISFYILCMEKDIKSYFSINRKIKNLYTVFLLIKIIFKFKYNFYWPSHIPAVLVWGGA